MNFIDLNDKQHQSETLADDQMAMDVLHGLDAIPKYISSKYFYDARGSSIFADIMKLDDYYLTNCEFEILNNHSLNMAKLMPESLSVIEFGAGNGLKTKVLLNALIDQVENLEYVPIDISVDALKSLETNLEEQLKKIPSTAVIGDYFNALSWVGKNRKDIKLILFLGSNIGNFTREKAINFLRQIWGYSNHNDYLMIGFDLKKDIEVLKAAYDDSDGITTAFNLNILERFNRELGANFDLDKFKHHAVYNPLRGAMESYLVSTVQQEVLIKRIKKRFSFKAYEPIHLEYSYKYLISDIENLANEAGFEIIQNHFDTEKYFVDSLWQIKKQL